MQNIPKFSKYLNRSIIKNKQIYYKKKNILKYKNEKFKSFLRATKDFDENTLLYEGGRRIQNFYRKSNLNKPLITIITVVLNIDKDLEKTIKSVLLQNYNNIEYIIIDGGSSINTISIIKKYNKFIDYWISQKDKGIFDAQNKGIKLATGDYICFLNAGDYFTKNCMEHILKKIKNRKKLDIIFGSVKKKKIFSGFSPERIKSRLNIFPSFVSTFVHIKLFKIYGLFDISFKCFNDYEFIYRILENRKLNWEITKKNELITIFDLKGFSSKIKIHQRLLDEFRIRIRYENFILVFFKIFVKYFNYYYLKIFKSKLFEKYN